MEQGFIHVRGELHVTNTRANIHSRCSEVCARVPSKSGFGSRLRRYYISSLALQPSETIVKGWLIQVHRFISFYTSRPSKLNLQSCSSGDKVNAPEVQNEKVQSSPN